MIFHLHFSGVIRRAATVVLIGALLTLAGCAQPGAGLGALSGSGAHAPGSLTGGDAPESGSLITGDALARTGQSATRHAAQTSDIEASRASDKASAAPPPDPMANADTPSPTPTCACGSTFQQTGMATWYGKRFHGRRTASGERYDMHALTAAHRTLPLGTCVRVTAFGGARSVIVRINDRGPFVRGRIIDLSYAAAQALGLGSSGEAQVTLERVAAARRCLEARA
jgi:rare lipoprotein A